MFKSQWRQKIKTEKENSYLSKKSVGMELTRGRCGIRPMGVAPLEFWKQIFQ